MQNEMAPTRGLPTIGAALAFPSGTLEVPLLQSTAPAANLNEIAERAANNLADATQRIIEAADKVIWAAQDAAYQARHECFSPEQTSLINWVKSPRVMIHLPEPTRGPTAASQLGLLVVLLPILAFAGFVTARLSGQ